MSSLGVEIWSGDERIAIHPKAIRAGQRFTIPGQWVGLEREDTCRTKVVLGVQLPSLEVQRRPLEVYDRLVAREVV